MYVLMAVEGFQEKVTMIKEFFKLLLALCPSSPFAKESHTISPIASVVLTNTVNFGKVHPHQMRI